MRELIAKYCSTLKLGSRIVQNYPDIQAQTHEEFLAKLLAMEVEARERNRKNLLLKQAQFDVIKTFGNYRFEKMSIPNSIDIETLKNTSFIDKKENLILYGPVGLGKTHLATAIGVKPATRADMSDFQDGVRINQLLDAKADCSLKRFLKQLDKAGS